MDPPAARRIEPPAPSLTPREREVLGYVRRGHNNKSIAAECGITTQSVKEHVSVLLRKFGVPNRTLLAQAAAHIDLVGRASVSPAWLRMLFADAPLGIAMLQGPELRFRLANDAYRRLFGIRELIGMTVAEALPHVDTSTWIPHLTRVYESGDPFTRSEFLTTWDSGTGPREFYLNFLIEPLRSDTRVIDGVALYVMDVTEEVRARQRVIEALSFDHGVLSLLFGDTPVGIAILEGPHHRFVAANEEYRRVSGGRQLVGRTAAEAFPELAGGFTIADEVYRTGMPRIDHAAAYRWDRRGRGTEDGHLTSVTAPLRTAEGDATRQILLVVIDVTDHVLPGRTSSWTGA